MKVKKLFFYVLLMSLFVSDVVYSQALIPGFSQSVSGQIGNNTNAAWSADGSKLLFQSDRNVNWDIYMFNMANDSLIQLTSSVYNEQDPVWFPNKNSIVFVSDQSGQNQLYELNLDTKETKLLFDRKIICQQPSFSNYDSMIVFSGYDEDAKTWQIFSFDFKYNNLNQLTKLPSNCANPAFAPNGKMVAFEYLPDPNSTLTNIYVINWYGDFVYQSPSMDWISPSWTPDCYRIVYIDTNGDDSGINSMKTDGSSIFDMSNEIVAGKNPVISPDGKFLAISLLQQGNFDLVIMYIEQ